MADIAEYWVIDPRPGKLRADFFRLHDQGQYELFASEDDEKVAPVVLPGFWLGPALTLAGGRAGPLPGP